jgi:hypothetical protein
MPVTRNAALLGCLGCTPTSKSYAPLSERTNTRADEVAHILRLSQPDLVLILDEPDCLYLHGALTIVEIPNQYRVVRLDREFLAVVRGKDVFNFKAHNLILLKLPPSNKLGGCYKEKGR